MSTTVINDRQAAIEQLNSMIQDIDIAMFTTLAQSGLLRSRPMTTASRRFDGDLWFFTLKSDPRVCDIEADSRVGISYSCPNARSYVSISGSASMVEDEQKFETFWRDDLNQWFPDGLESSDLALIKVRVDYAEYWDHSNSTMVRLLNFVKSLVTGDSTDEVEHEELNWPRAVTPANLGNESGS